jgi:oligopeptide/dipeptide ABC transporter ATP-binding protein
MLEATDLVIKFGSVAAVDGVSLSIPAGPYGFGLVGESGSGKTTIGRAIVRLIDCDSGRLTYEGQDVTRLRGRPLRTFRSKVQIVFQDPYSALDPRRRVGSHIAEALRTHNVVPRSETDGRVQELLEEVGLDPADFVGRHPHQLSGGQRQRVVIARALAVDPQLVVLDEPTSALDVTVQARVLALLERVREQRRVAYLLISHNLAVIERLCQHVVVLYLGKVVESAPTESLIRRPVHPYSQMLRLAVPELELERRAPIPDSRADRQETVEYPTGCRFHPRCPLAIDRCRSEVPALREITANHWVACHRLSTATAAWRDARTAEAVGAISRNTGEDA